MDNNPRRVIRLAWIPSRSVVSLMAYMQRRDKVINEKVTKLKGFIEKIQSVKDCIDKFNT